jgi:calcineurin-like phosphoesterase family protein
VASGTTWVYSDPHFSDPDQKLMDPNWPDDKTQLNRINSKVGRGDTIILLGDCGNLDYTRRIKGYKVLIKGNHDSGSTKYKEIFNEVYEGPILAGPQLLFSHEPVTLPFVFNFHGHIHNSLHQNDSLHFNCCSNIINFEPINLNQFIKRNAPLAKIPSIHRITIDEASRKQ